jgi:glycosyltransferase involved in cell wall biosynthesis
LHILIIHQAFASPREPGGTRHYELARYLIDHGHQVTIVASDLSYMSGERMTSGEGLATEKDLEGVKVMRAYTYPTLHRSFVWRVLSFFSFMLFSFLASMRVKNIDLVMGTSPPIFQAVSAWLVALLRMKPFLLEIRDLWPEFAIDMGVLKSKLLIHPSRRLEHFLYTVADHILVNSPAYRTYVIGKGVSSRKTSLIPNGVDTGQFNPEENGERVRQDLGLNGKFVVTYAGALGLANDIPTLLKAAERLGHEKGIHFLLVGDGKERKNLVSWGKAHDLKNVTFTGPRPKSEMPLILSSSDACVAILQNIPMFRMTYPNKVFDYMAAARPTILAIDGVIRKVLEESQGGIFVQPGDDVALARAVASLASDRSKAQAMGLAARKYVVRHFNRSDQAASFLSLLTCLCKQRRRKGLRCTPTPDK